MPCGGIAPERTFLITFSHAAPSRATLPRSSASSARSAVRVRRVVTRDAVLADKGLVWPRAWCGRPDWRRLRRRPRLRRALRCRGRRRGLLHDQEQVVRIRRDRQPPRPGPECHRHRRAIARDHGAARRGDTGERGVDVAHVQLQAERARILDARSRRGTRRALQLHELQQQRRVRHAHRGQAVLDVAQPQHRRHLRARREGAQIALESEPLLVERQRAVHVARR